MENKQKTFKIKDLIPLLAIPILIGIVIMRGVKMVDWIRMFTSLIEVIIGVLLLYGYGKIRNNFVKIVMIVSIVALFIIGGYNFIISFS